VSESDTEGTQVINLLRRSDKYSRRGNTQEIRRAIFCVTLSADRIRSSLFSTMSRETIRELRSLFALDACLRNSVTRLRKGEIFREMIKNNKPVHEDA